MTYPKRLLDLWRATKFGAKLRGPRPRSWEVLDVWAGDTVQIDGKTFFKMPDGTLLPAISGGGAQGWEELIDTLVADGTPVANSTTETILCPDFNIPAYYMAPGRTLRITASGTISNVVTAEPTFILRLRWHTAGPVLLASAAVISDTTARTGALWRAEMVVVCRTAGATGTFMSNGFASFANLKASAVLTNNTTTFNSFTSLLGSAGAPVASGNAAVTVDTTTAKLLSVTGQWGAASASNTATCQTRMIEVLN